MASLLPSLRSAAPRSAASIRAFASTSRAFADPPSEPSSTASSTGPVAGSATAGDAAPSDSQVQEAERYDAPAPQAGRGYRAWLNGEGARFRTGIKGRANWIGDTPFPLNPTFHPLPPLADATKTKIYNAYVHNILLKNATDSQVVRAVSSKFGVGMDRVRAVIRLKELEKSWMEEGRALQTELLKGMETHLGVKAPGEHWRGVESPDPVKPQLASNKTIFEMVDVESGDSPVFLPLLSRVPNREVPLTSTPLSDSPSTLRSTSNTTVVPPSRPGRAATVFTDLSATKEGEALKKSYDPKKTKRGLPAKKAVQA
ncbi:hypothetical protein JCM21900_003455 [Sporobolomyces salmonicolor]